MNIILDPLPESVEVDSQNYPVNWGFRTFILIEICIFDKKLSDNDRIQNALELFYLDVPNDFNHAFEMMMWFYRGGKELKPEKKGSADPKRCYCFEQDAPYIYSAFKTQYGIDLQDLLSKDLHWWKFKALFESLDDDLKMSKIMLYRVVDTAGMDKSQKKFYAVMKKLYALESEANANSKMALAKRDADMLIHINRKMKEVNSEKES